MKSYLKNLGAIFAQSFTKEVLLGVLFVFVAIMVTIGAQGQNGLAVIGLEAVYYGDEIGSSILDGQTFESYLAAGEVDEALEKSFHFFLVKALFALLAFVVILYSVFVLTETAIWNLFTHKLSVKGFWLRARLNIILLFIAATEALVLLIIYVGLQYFRIIALLDTPFALLGNTVAFVGGAMILHMFFATNMMALKRKSVRTILREYLKFSPVSLKNLIPIYAAVILLLLIFASFGSLVNMQFPNAYGLLSVLSLTIPLVWLRQLLYLDWKQRNSSK